MCDICEPTGKTWRKISEDKGKMTTIFHCTSIDLKWCDLVSKLEVEECVQTVVYTLPIDSFCKVKFSERQSVNFLT